MSKRKNILLLIPTFADQGGAQKMVFELGKLLSEKYNVIECSFDSFNEPHIFKNNNKVISLEIPQEKGVLKKLSFYFKSIKKLKRIKKENDIHITISNLWAADFINALSFQGDKIISVAHINIEGNRQNILLYRFRYIIGLVYRRFNKIVAVSDPLRDELINIFKLSNRKIVTINNFISFPKAKYLLNKVKPKQRLVNIGRLNEVKNQESLLKIFNEIRKEFKNLQLIIIGDGPLKKHLTQLSSQLGLIIGHELDANSDIIFTGFLNDPYSILFASDIFVFPSKSEGLPLVLVEAMFAGLPIITSDCLTGPHMIMQGSRNFVINRTDIEETPYGYLMPIPDINNEISIEIWKSTILDLINDEKKLRSISKNVRNRAFDFEKDKIKDKWFELLESV